VLLLLERIPRRLRRPAGPLLFAIDHCFAIRGQGTVLTGTVLQVAAVARSCSSMLLVITLGPRHALRDSVTTDEMCEGRIAQTSYKHCHLTKLRARLHAVCCVSERYANWECRAQ